MRHRPSFMSPFSHHWGMGMMRMCCGHGGFSHGGGYDTAEQFSEKVVKKLSKELDLNDQQQKELARIKNEIQAKHKELHKTKQAMFSSILDQVKGDELNQDKIKELFSEKISHEEMLSFALDKFSEFHRVLTKEQREKLAEKMAQFHEFHYC